MKIEDVLELVRPNIKQLTPYSSARDEYKGEVGIFLDANENSFGSPIDPCVNRYPDPLQTQVKKKLASIKNIYPDQIFLGNGSDESIDVLLRTFCKPGQDEVIILPPTYGMYEVAAKIHELQVKKILLDDTFQPDVTEILNQFNSNTRMIFFCSPNNPTGNLMDYDRIKIVLEKFKGIVVVDEAYIDYAKSSSWIQELKNYPHLVVLQTFSKAWGLAGIRAGMAFAHPQIITILNKVKMPYNVSSITQKYLLEAMNNQAFVEFAIQQTIQEKTHLIQRLQQFKSVKTIYPSDANFLLVKMNQADEVYQQLIEKKIIIRNRSRVEKCNNCLRITIGKPHENKALLEALSQIIN
ncbi:MAG: histidinol-phosphate transaminase [Flavobacteriales bacterium]|nr:histidinol-phosphate transaminase [Flavobacteriales bacterium]